MTANLVYAGAGITYAAVLWAIAAAVARHRALALGPAPAWLFASCGGTAFGLCALLPTATALPATAGLLGAIVCGIVDARTGLIFDALSLTVAASAWGTAILEHRGAENWFAAIVVGGLLTLLWALTGRRGIGLGDVKLGSAVALGYGLPAGLVAIGSAFVLGAAYAILKVATGRARRTDTLRFGPFIAGGAAVGITAGYFAWPW